MPEKEPDYFHVSLPDLKEFGEIHFRFSGWVRVIGHDDNGMFVQWTEEGERNFAALWELYSQIGATSFTPEDAKRFHCLMMILSGNERHLPRA